MNIMLTSRCNFGCDICCYNCSNIPNEHGADLTPESPITLKLQEIAINKDKFNFIGGEPTLPEKFDETIKTIVSTNKLDYFRMVSNGTFLLSQSKRNKMAILLHWAYDRFCKQEKKSVSPIINYKNKEPAIILGISDDNWHRAFWGNNDFIKMVKQWQNEFNLHFVYLIDYSSQSDIAIINIGRCGHESTRNLHQNSFCYDYTYMTRNTNITNTEKFSIDAAGNIYLCPLNQVKYANILEHSEAEINERFNACLSLLDKNYYTYEDCHDCKLNLQPKVDKMLNRVLV